MLLLLMFAFLSGIITVLSPCILPVLPLLLSAGVGQGKYRPYGIIIGLIMSFTFFTLSLTGLVHATGVSPDVLRYISLGLILFFGLTLLFPRIEKLFFLFTAPLAGLGNKIQGASTAGTGFASGFILGIALGLIWAPCAGPILATVTTLVATGSITWSTVMVTIAYSCGTALPMFFIIYGGNRIVTSISAIAPYTEAIRKIFGVLMILGACAIAFHFDVILQQFALKYFPTIKIEENTYVKKELDTLQGASMSNSSPAPVIGARAPEFTGIIEWINSPALTIKQLEGSVVLIDFWTYSCINCVRTLPFLKKWYATYKNQGLVIVGVHTPEFEFEKSSTNVKDAVKRFEIEYPVALDNNFATWKTYHNRYWPAHYLIDKQGVIQYIHFGEGEYVKTENKIRSLLGLAPLVESEKQQALSQQTPEIYLGYKRAEHYTSELTIEHDKTMAYDYHTVLAPDEVGLKGKWIVLSESITSKGSDARLSLNFIGQHVYLVMSAEKPSLVTVMLDGQPLPPEFYTDDMNSQGEIKVNTSRMYKVLDFKKPMGRHTLTLQVPENVSLYAFTFGG